MGGGPEYDAGRGGWLFENMNGPLALVRDDGTVVAPVYDRDACQWIIPNE